VKGREEAETVVGGYARRQALAGTDLEAEHALLRAPVEGGWHVMARVSGKKGARVAIRCVGCDWERDMGSVRAEEVLSNGYCARATSSWMA
jgi:hypothetical protein